MSKFLKFIVHLVIVCTIIGVLALVVPPFLGINTTIVDSADMETNLPFGSVTYAKSVPVGALQTGDSVMFNEDGGIYRYRLTGADAEQNVFTVKNTRDSKGEERDIALKNNAPRVIITIGYLGYLLVAVQSVEGMIIIGLVILFLIILYIIAELWKKDSKKNMPEGEQEGMEAEDGDAVLKSEKELKQEEKARAQQMKEEDRQMRAEEKRRRKEEKKRKKAIRTGGFVDEIDEDEFERPEPEQKKDVVPVRPAPAPVTTESQTNGKEPAVLPGTSEQQVVRAEEAKLEQPEVMEDHAAPDSQAEILQELETARETEPVAEIKKMAIPLYTAQQLQEKAAAAGDDPEIYQDQVSGITLFDYSKILTGEAEE